VFTLLAVAVVLAVREEILLAVMAVLAALALRHLLLGQA
jgi:hypothetical protein